MAIVVGFVIGVLLAQGSWFLACLLILALMLGD